MRKKEILVAENKAEVALTIKARLEREQQFAVDVVSTAAETLRRLSVSVPDALLLDAGLPDGTVHELCRLVRSRERTARLPVIMLGGDATGIGLVEGLELGADDFVAKPFEPAELEARLKAVLRRHVHQRESAPDHFKGDHLDANFADVNVSVDGRPVSLTKREFHLLRFLVRHCNEVLGREVLLSNVWGAEGWDCRIVDSAIWKLRKKLGDAARQIETVAGFGYRFSERGNGRSGQ